MEKVLETKQSSAITKIKVFSNPALNSLLKHTPFYSNNDLFAIHVLKLQANEGFTLEAGSAPQLIFAFQGNAKLSDSGTQLNAQDIIELPKNKTLHIESDKQGFQAWCITIEKSVAENEISEIKNNLNYFEKILIFNQQCIQNFSKNSFFEIIKNGNLYEPHKRQKLLECIAVCNANPNIFELSNGSNAFYDSVLAALRDWFSYQMLVLDHIEKHAIIYLVIEPANAIYADMIQNYFPMYNEAQTQLLNSPLNNTKINFSERDFYKQNLENLERIHQIIKQAWESIEAMTQRIVDLIT